MMRTPNIPFAMSLTLAKEEEPATRLAKLVTASCCVGLRWSISEIDATGDYGNSLTRLANSRRTLALTRDDMLRLLLEDGQVFELQVDGHDDHGRLLKRALISDGRYLDWMGFGNPAEEGEIGEFTIQSCELFNWPKAES